MNSSDKGVSEIYRLFGTCFFKKKKKSTRNMLNKNVPGTLKWNNL